VKQVASIVFSVACLMGPAVLADEKAVEVFEHYCFDCHGDGAKKGGLDLSGMLGKEDFDGSLIFENLVTGKMPPADKDQPEAEEKRAVLDWLAKVRERRSLSLPAAFLSPAPPGNFPKKVRKLNEKKASATKTVMSVSLPSTGVTQRRGLLKCN